MPSFAFQNKAKCLVWFDRPSNLSILVWWSWKKKQALCVIYSRHSASSRTGKLPTIKPAQFRMLKTKQQQQQQKKKTLRKRVLGALHILSGLFLSFPPNVVVVTHWAFEMNETVTSRTRVNSCVLSPLGRVRGPPISFPCLFSPCAYASSCIYSFSANIYIYIYI